MARKKQSGINPFSKSDYPYCYKGHEYALDIISGKIVACKYIISACKRYINDLARIEKYKTCPFYFDKDKAERFLRVVQNFNHAVGDWKTERIIFEPWQCFAWMNIKGFYSHYSKAVRFRTIHLDVGRGNAKSTMASQASLYDLCCDEPNGNRIYCAATSRQQAGEVLEGARIMANKSKSFLKNFGVEVRANEVLHQSSNSFIKSISAQANNADGKIGKTIITDELHAMGRKLFETLVSGQSKRRDSQIISITTAGYKNDGIGYSQRAYAKKVALGDLEDETFFSLVYCIDEGDDPFDPKNWIKANPNFGVSVDPVNFEAQAKKAKANPEDKAGFLIKHLNLYLDSANQFYDVSKWRLCANRNLKLEQFEGRPCYVGIDIASKVDLTSICFNFKDDKKYSLFYLNFVPEERLKSPDRQNYVKYVEEGDLIATPGEAINLVKMYDVLLQYLRRFRILGVLADPWNALELITKLNTDRYNVMEFRMNTANFSEPMKKLDAEIKSRNVEHNSNSLLEWCLGNVVAKYDHNDNVFPRKEHESLKIDPIISTLMTLGAHIGDEQKQNVYETRGLIVL